ncbi:MAG: MFS transporter [Flavisolibacter sp.]|nr:MFS transporter [Flavisolibacter sp.]MBD0351576.1 MFS transporter [Flavisolibacter sp.]
MVVSALGYFVDLYDLLLFSVVRTKSLLELSIAQEDVLTVGLNLLNWMLIGMMLGGIVWGILGDKKGRLSVLFGSITIYSLANFLNGYIHSIEHYRILRFLSGFGLAGELGAGVTLISEMMQPQRRGYGIMIITAIGMLGASFAAYVGLHYDWRFAFKLGGIMGFLLLALRIRVKESPVFQNTLSKTVSRGNFLKLITKRQLALKYLKLIILGLPIFFVIGILVTATPEFAKAFGMKQMPTAGVAIMITYIFISIGDILCTVISQVLKSRKKAISVFLLITLSGIWFYIFIPAETIFGFYLKCAIMGVGIGYLSILVTYVAEQFGTNYRATATISAPNFIRGLLPLVISPVFLFMKPHLGLLNSAAIVGMACVSIPLITLFSLKEHFGKPLNWTEPIE